MRMKTSARGLLLDSYLKETCADITKNLGSLNGALEQCDLWKRVTESFKKVKQHLEKELQMIKKELALKIIFVCVLDLFTANRKILLLTKDSKKTFANMYCSIEGLFLKYFHDIDSKVDVLFRSRALYLPNNRTSKAYTTSWL
jgi:hypothetical protein